MTSAWPFIAIAVGAALFGARSAFGASSSSDEAPTPASSDPDDPETKYDALFQRYALQAGVPWTWVKGICLNETLLGTDRYYLAHAQGSSDGKSWGIMQLTLPTASDMAGYAVSAEQLRDDEFSIRYGAAYLGTLYRHFSADEQDVVMAYNEGIGNVEKGKTVDDYYSRWARWVTKIENGEALLS